MTKPAGQRAVPGDSIRDVVTASAWNSMLDMLDSWRRSAGGFNVAPGEVTSGDCVIEVKNDTGEDLSRWACVGLGDVTVAPSENTDEFIERHVVTATTPASTHATKFAILQEAIPDGEIGRAVVCGKTIATVNVSNTSHGYASPEAGSYRLQSGDTGLARILYVETTGTQDALVVIGAGSGAPSSDDNGGDTNTTLINGCDVSDCLPDGSPFAIKLKGDADCKEVPEKWEIGGVIGARGQCCDGRIWFDYDRWLSESGPGNTYFPIILDHVGNTGKLWRSAWIECSDLLRQRDPNAGCGTATWEWSNEPTELDCGQEWQSQVNECTGVNTWIADNPSPEILVWLLLSSSCECEGGYETPVAPSSQPPYAGFITTTPCVPTQPYKWIRPTGVTPGCPDGTCSGVDADPDGGPLGPPATAPTGPGQYQSYPCTVTTSGDPAWVMISGCRCGTAVAPSSPGTEIGQRVTTICEQTTDTDGDGYGDGSTELLVRWEMNADVEPATLKLVDSAGNVYFSYAIPSPRVFCCMCANSFIFAGCGPYYRCPPAGSICVRPHVPAGCDSLGTDAGCDSTQFDVEITAPDAPAGWNTGLTTDEQFNYIWPYISDIDGYFQLTAVTPDQLLEAAPVGIFARYGCCAGYAKIVRESTVLTTQGPSSPYESEQIRRRTWDIHYAGYEFTAEPAPGTCDAAAVPYLTVNGIVETLFRYKAGQNPDISTWSELGVYPIGDPEDPSTWWGFTAGGTDLLTMQLEGDVEGECGVEIAFTATSLFAEGDDLSAEGLGGSAVGNVVPA